MGSPRRVRARANGEGLAGGVSSSASTDAADRGRAMMLGMAVPGLTVLDMVNARLANAAAAAADTAATTGANVVEKKSDWLSPLSDSLEALLKLLDNGLEAAHVPYSYGFAIILLTVFVKALTFPLTKASMESTTAIQRIQPRVAELKAKYPNDQEKLQLETARLYQTNGINPLAGCVPTLATIPIFIGLYRGLTQAADDGLLVDGFFFLPSLAGPTSIAERQSGMGLQWLMPLVDGAPPIGWHDAGAYLILPVLIIAFQYVSQSVMSAGNPAAQEQQKNPVFKFLPLMLGYFSLNVPSGLTLYWLTNSVLTTAQQVYLKKVVTAEADAREKEEAGAAGNSAGRPGGGPIDVPYFSSDASPAPAKPKPIPPPAPALMDEFAGMGSDSGSVPKRETTEKVTAPASGSSGNNQSKAPQSKAARRRAAKKSRRR